jgi:hypothetical protein
LRRRVQVSPEQQADVKFELGVLAINLQPWARVSVDGRDRGTTPLRLVLPAGEHDVALHNPQRKLRHQRNVAITPGRTTRISSW